MQYDFPKMKGGMGRGVCVKGLLGLIRFSVATCPFLQCNILSVKLFYKIYASLIFYLISIYMSKTLSYTSVKYFSTALHHNILMAKSFDKITASTNNQLKYFSWHSYV